MAGHPIDSLFVEIGLDATKFDKQQRDFINKFKQTQEDARKGARDIEDSGISVGRSLDGIKSQALAMFAVFTGGKGLIDFTEQLTHADAEIGRFSRSTGVSETTISKWSAAARIFGGDAKTMAQSFVSISDAFAGWKIGAISPLIADLRAISTAGGKIIDINKGVEQSFIDLSENLKKIYDSGPDGPAQAGLLGRRAGIDPALLDILLRGPEATKKILDQVSALGPATKASADAAGELERRWNAIFVRTEGTGRQAGLIPDILKASDILNMTPSEAWDYFTNPNSKVRKPGSPLFAGTSSGLGSDAPKAGAFGSQAEKEAFIRAEAAKRGIDPDVAMRVARAEGFDHFKSAIPGEESYSAFQLNMKPGNEGDKFMRATGFDPRIPANERASISWALDDVARTGWQHYHGAGNNNIPRWAGIAAAGGGGTSGTTVHDDHSIHVDKVEIHAGAGADGTKIASDFRAALIKRQSNVAQSDYGQN